MARVSNPYNQANDATAERLINYLLEHRHWSPFEMVDMCLEITTSRAIAPQILRHRSFSFQEFSQRYAEAQTFEPIEFRKQGKRKQGGEELAELDSKLQMMVDDVVIVANSAYNYLLAQGVSRETARMILPLSTRTRLYMKGSIRSWIHYIQVRTHPDTQKEHREIAEAARLILLDWLPEIEPHLEPNVKKKCGNCEHSANNYCKLYDFFANDENHFCSSHQNLK